MNFAQIFRHALMNADVDAAGAGAADAATDAAAQAAAATTKLDEGKPTGKKEDEQEAPPAKADDAAVLDKAGFASTDDPGLNYSLTFLARNGFTADNPAVDAAMGGDFSLLKAELAAKGVPGWEQALALGEQAYGRAEEKQKAAIAEVGKVVLEVAERSGVDWEAAVQHIGTSATPEIKTALNGLLSDPATAAIAAGYITNSFIEGSNEEMQPRATATGDNALAARTAQGGKLSRAEYTKEMRELYKKLGDGYMQSPEAQALYARLA